MNYTPVWYVGLQEGFSEQGIGDFYLVDEPNGSTVAFKPDEHRISGIAASAFRRGLRMVPGELIPYLVDKESRSNVEREAPEVMT